MCNVTRNEAEVTGLGREEQSIIRPSEEIFGYPRRRLSTPLYKASATKEQTMQAMTNSCRSLQSIPRNIKKCYKARFTSFFCHTSSF